MRNRHDKSELTRLEKYIMGIKNLHDIEEYTTTSFENRVAIMDAIVNNYVLLVIGNPNDIKTIMQQLKEVHKNTIAMYIDNDASYGYAGEVCVIETKDGKINEVHYEGENVL